MSRGVIWPDVGDLVLLVDLEPAPQDVQVRGSSDEAPALGGFLDSVVEAEESGGVQPVKGAGRQRKCLQCERLTYDAGPSPVAWASCFPLSSVRCETFQ